MRGEKKKDGTFQHQSKMEASKKTGIVLKDFDEMLVHVGSWGKFQEFFTAYNSSFFLFVYTIE